MQRTLSQRRGQTALACCLLLLPTLLLYWPVTGFDFINLDDRDYVTANHFVSQGLTWPGFLWAFHTVHAANWHPLTWLSLMLDVQLFGLHPGGLHFVNLLLHLANTLLLFFLLHRLTGALWRSGFVAALFALHPLHVESVAWVSERKDVLSTCFGLLALLAYAQSVPKGVRREKAYAPAPRTPHLAPSPHSALRTPHSTFWYLVALLLFALSLMSKPMLVTLPCLLLLLDCWPLQRFVIGTQHSKVQSLLPLFWEKVPFFILSAVSSGITVIAQRSALASFESAPLASRLVNLPLAYLAYFGKTFWPHPLAMFYPYRHDWSPLLVAAAFLLLLALSIAAALAAPRRPWLTVGWFAFLGLLVPVIGLVQVGGQAMADRYTYLPLVGLFIALSWGVPDFLNRWAFRRLGLLVSASAVLLACFVVARAQVPCWANTETLCRHALRVTKGNALAHACLGEDLLNQKRLEEAKVQFTLALEANPSYCFAFVELGKTVLAMGAVDEAEVRFQHALRLQPDNLEAHRLLAEAYSLQKRPREARQELAELARLDPDSPAVLNNLAWLLATHPDPELRDGPRAVSLAERSCQLTGRTNLWLLSTLAAAYAEAGRFDQAVETQQKVCSLAAALVPSREATPVPPREPQSSAQAVSLSGSPALLRTTQVRLELYRTGHPYRQAE